MAPGQQSRELVEQWIAKQSDNTPLLASMIARELKGKIDVLDVADVLTSLRKSGAIREAFAVKIPAGTVLRQTYQSLDEIEPEVRDSFNRSVPRDDLEILPAFEKVRR